MPYTPILGTLGYVLSPCGGKVLFVHRNKRESDAHKGKYNGLGGKMEMGEDVLTCMKREIKEEAGIECLSMEMRGTINWTGFGPNGEDWLGFIFLITSFSGTPFEENEEGVLSWISKEKISDLPMWDGDRYFLPLVFDEDKRPFHGLMPYKNNVVQNWNYIRL